MPVFSPRFVSSIKNVFVPGLEYFVDVKKAIRFT